MGFHLFINQMAKSNKLYSFHFSLFKAKKTSRDTCQNPVQTLDFSTNLSYEFTLEMYR